MARRLSWARLAMALVMAAQLVVGVITPFVHARAQSSIGSHLESQGERRHYIHDEGRCAVCAARHLVATVAPPPPPLPLSRSRAVVARPVASEASPQVRRTPSAPRAPPARARVA